MDVSPRASQLLSAQDARKSLRNRVIARRQRGVAQKKHRGSQTCAVTALVCCAKNKNQKAVVQRWLSTLEGTDANDVCGIGRCEGANCSRGTRTRNGDGSPVRQSSRRPNLNKGAACRWCTLECNCLECSDERRLLAARGSGADVTSLISGRLCVTCVVLVFGLVTFPGFRLAGGMLTATQAAWCCESPNEPHYVPEVKDAVACIDRARILLSVQRTHENI